MKLLDDVKTEIKQILATDTRELKKYAVNKLRKRVEFLEVVKKYLESNPNEVFVKTEKQRMEDLVDAINNGFSAWLTWNKDKGSTYKEQKDFYEKERELKKYKTQYRALDFILS